MPWKHVFAPTMGYRADTLPTTAPPESSTYNKGIYFKDGEVRSDFGHVDYPTVSDAATNELNGTVMRLDQFYLKDGTSHLLAATTTCLYRYNTSTDTWDVQSVGTEIDDCENSWDAQADVTCAADAVIKIRDSKSSLSTVDADFTTGLASSEDNLSNADISNTTDHTHLSFWIRSSVAFVAGDCRIRLSEQAAGGVGATYADYNIPATSAGAWVHHVVDITAPDADNGGTYPDDLNALASVALVVVNDKGAVNINLDDIRAIRCFTGDEDNRFSVATMNDTFLLTNGLDQPQKITESGGVLTTASLTTTLAAGSITTSEVVFAFKDHLLLMSNTENGADAPQRVTWSNIGALEDWTVGTAGYQDLVDDESWIVSAEQIGENEIVIYKERSIISMAWVGGHTPFRFKTMVTGIGLVGKEAITDLGGEHLFVSPDAVCSYKGGTTVDTIDDGLSTLMYDAFDRTYELRTFVVYIEEDDEVQIWIPTSTAYPDDVWCYSVVKESWYRKDRTMTGFGYYSAQSSLTIGDLVGTIGEQNWRFGDALTRANSPITLVGDSNGKVYQLSKTTANNDGTAITNEFQTPDFTLPNTPEYMNKFMRVMQLLVEAKENSITCHYSTDGGGTWSPCQVGGGSISLTSTFDIYQEDFDTVCRKIRFRFKNTTASSGFTFRYYGFYWKIRSGRR